MKLNRRFCAIALCTTVINGCCICQGLSAPMPPGDSAPLPAPEQIKSLLTSAKESVAARDRVPAGGERSEREGLLATKPLVLESIRDRDVAVLEFVRRAVLKDAYRPLLANDPRANPEVARLEIELLQGYAKLELQPWVVGGVRAKPDQYPEVVAVGRVVAKDDGTIEKRWCCSGVLIARNAVLTAGHCFLPRCLDDGHLSGVAKDVWVHFGAGGDDDTDSSLPQSHFGNIQVDRFYRYDRALPEGVHNDLAVLILKSDTPVPYARFAPSGDIDTTKRFTVAGFGMDDASRRGLKQFGVVAVASPECAEEGAPGKWGCGRTYECVASDKILEKPPQRPVDTCAGDSGGPAYLESLSAAGRGERLLAGITSRGVNENVGRKCGHGGIYTRVDRAEYQTWIQDPNRVPGIHW